MPFGLKNALDIFSRIVIVALKELFQKFLDVYFDDWTVFGLIKCHVASLHLMLDTCQRYQIVLNLKKCLFCFPFGILLAHVVCKQGIMVDPANIMVIVNLEAPPKECQTAVCNAGPYWILSEVHQGLCSDDHAYGEAIKKDATFYWDEECQHSLDVLKEKMVTTLILVFLDWKKEFHVHIDFSCIALGAVLTQADEGEMDHPITFARRKLSKAEKNYSRIEYEGLAMVYTLQKFRRYLLGGHFKMYKDHSALKYLVNNIVLGGKICRWLLLF